MSTLVAQTISNGTVSTSTANVINGAKAWVNFNGTGTVAIRGSYNVSSITDDGTGDYRVNFTNALTDSNYSAVLSADVDGVGDFAIACLDLRTGGRTTSTVRVRIGNTGGGAADSSVICVAVFR